jgi:hypothetical protein
MNNMNLNIEVLENVEALDWMDWAAGFAAGVAVGTVVGIIVAT